jgi:uncharacterized protein with HEPN domain
MQRDDAYVKDILLAARKVVAFTTGVTWNAIAADERIQSSVLWQIGIMGEAARRVSDRLREQHPEIPWYEIVGMRNRLVHDYSRIDFREV